MLFERVYTDELTSYGRCVPEGNQWKGFIAVLAILNFAALIVVNVQAYKARSINDELSESKYIGLATLSMFQVRFEIIETLFAAPAVRTILLTKTLSDLYCWSPSPRDRLQ